MIAVLGLIAGIVIGFMVDPTIPVWIQPFLPVAVVAGLDALFGAGRAWLEGVFSDRVFIMSFFWNVLVACLLVFLGQQLGAISLAARCRRRSRYPYLLQRRVHPSSYFQGVGARQWHVILRTNPRYRAVHGCERLFWPVRGRSIFFLSSSA